MIATESSSQTKVITEARRTGLSLAGLRVRGLELMGLVAVLLLAGWLNLWRISQNGYGNSYYATAVQSMLQSWHNFFFGSYDAGGFITVDKPAPGLWVQAASAWLFGFNGLSLILPEVLAGLATVAITFYLTRRAFGPLAGFVAALVTALTPIAIAVQRTNNLDAVLVLVLTLAAWAMLRAVETGRLWQLLLAVMLVGVGFNVKMLEAFVVLPAFYLVYLLMARGGWWRRVAHLSIATVVLAVVSLSWAVAVDLTPAANRPYIGGSKTNSVLELALGYNGLGRVTGQGENFGPGGGRGFPGGGPATGGDAQPLPQPPNGAFQGGPPQAGGNFFGGPGGGNPFDSGTPGALRLFGADLAGQWSWMFPLALVGVASAIWVNRRRLRGPRGQFLLLWGGWLATYGVVFSFAQGIFHSYYLVMLAPALGALAGAGVASLWTVYRRGGWLALLLPAALVVTAAWQSTVVAGYASWGNVITPVLIGGSLVAVAMLLIPVLVKQPRRITWLASGALTVGLLALVVSPLAWSVTPALAAGNGTLPVAGPQNINGRGGFAGPGPMDTQVNSGLISYLEANRDGYFYLVALSSANQGSSIALQTGEPVLAIGGFTGSDPSMTVEKLQQMVADKQVRFVMVSGFGGGGPMGDNQAVSSWVQGSCSAAASSLWQSSDGSGTNGLGFPGGPMGLVRGGPLYDCAVR